MSDRISRLEARLCDLNRAVAEISRRIDALGGRTEPPTSSGPFARFPTSGIASRPQLMGVVTLMGRTLMVLGGAYLLRALTEAGRLPGVGGVILGLAYAVAWFGIADRVGAKRPLSGIFHGVAAVLIGVPLLWEAITRFHLLAPETTAAGLAILTGIALGVAWHRHLQSLAAVAVSGALVAATMLVFATREPIPFTALLIGLGVFTLWLSDACDWPWLRWPLALGVDLLLAGLAARAAVAAPLDPPAAVLVLQLLLIVAYGGSLALRTLIHQRPVRAFEVVQTAFVLVVGLGGALFVTHAKFANAHVLLGVVAAILGAASYLVAFERIGRRPEHAANFHFFMTAAFALVVVGSTTVLTGGPLVAALGLLAIAATWFGDRLFEPVLAVHGALFGVAAAAWSGLLQFSVSVWTATAAWPPVSPAAIWTAVALGLCLGLPRTRSLSKRTNHIPMLSEASRLTVAFLFVAGITSWLLWQVGPWLAGDLQKAGPIASIKTTTLAVVAVAVALTSRVERFAELGQLVYPVLVLGGVKLIFEDFRRSSPATLFVALAVYGAALIVAPRLAAKSAGGTVS